MGNSNVPNVALLPLLPPHTTSSKPDWGRLPGRPPSFPKHNPFQDLTDQLSDWSVQTFVFPAARPRTIVSPPAPKTNPPPDRRKSKVEVREELDRLWANTRDSPRRHESALESDSVQDPDLWIAANRYSTAREQRGGVTLVLAHANGFHKETWEPMISFLLLGPARHLIYEIWSLDAVNQGDSALLNRGHLPQYFDWMDHPRDIAQFLLLYLPPPDDLPNVKQGVLHPQPLPSMDALLLNNRIKPSLGSKIWRDRKVVLVGHSLGGGGSVGAATSLPFLLTGLLLVDPVISPPAFNRTQPTSALALGALSRRDLWADKQAAKATFRKNVNFFGRWHSAVLDRYVQCGLVSDPNGVTLKCPKEQEAAVFVDPLRRASHLYEQLCSADGNEMPPTQVIFADIGQSVLPELHIDTFRGQAKFASVDRVEGSGHLVVQEQPRLLATKVGAFLMSLPTSASKL